MVKRLTYDETMSYMNVIVCTGVSVYAIARGDVAIGLAFLAYSITMAWVYLPIIKYWRSRRGRG